MTTPADDLAAFDQAARPAAGLLAGTRVLTLEGELPVEFLNPGDRVITRSGARPLRRVTAQCLRGADVVRVAGSSLGHDRPERDLVIGAAQPVRVSDWRARAIFGAPSATVPVARLIDGSFIRRTTLERAQLLTLEFDREETVYAEGVEIGCPAMAEA